MLLLKGYVEDCNLSGSSQELLLFSLWDPRMYALSSSLYQCCTHMSLSPEEVSYVIESSRCAVHQGSGERPRPKDHHI